MAKARVASPYLKALDRSAGTPEHARGNPDWHRMMPHVAFLPESA